MAQAAQSNGYAISPMAEAKARLASARKMIAETTVTRLTESGQDPIRLTPDQRIRLWTAERIVAHSRGR